MSSLTKFEKFLALIFVILISLVWIWFVLLNYTETKNTDKFISTQLSLISERANILSKDITPIKKEKIEKKILKNQKIKNPFKDEITTTSLNISETDVIKISSIPEAINLSNLILSGIINVKGVTYAIINDNIVKENDMIFGASVEKISDRQVILKHKEQLYYINMSEGKE